jgi:hypothetical protein
MMTEKTYSKHVGEKFNPDGSARLFPGNTILCHVAPDSATMASLQQFYKAILKEPWVTNYAMLPPSSYHMTVFDLVCDQVRKRENWTSLLPIDSPMEVVDAMVMEHWLDAPEPPQPKVMLDSLEIGDYITMRLKPKDEASDRQLRDYRDALSILFGIRHPNHESYFFHLTYAYGITSLEPSEKAAIAKFVEAWEPLLKKDLSMLALEPPVLRFFADMTHFTPTRAGAYQNVTE